MSDVKHLGEFTPTKTISSGFPLHQPAQMKEAQRFALGSAQWSAGHDVSVLVHWNRLPDTTVTFRHGPYGETHEERLADGTTPDRSFKAISAHVHDIQTAYGVN